ncbi:MAG: arginase family protein [Bacteriovoracaceae bacterium]
MNKISELKKLLTAPGNGVFTVHTAKENKAALHEKYYNETDLEKVQLAWETSLDSIMENETLFLGVCSDSGGGILRGANWGPLYLREEFLKDNHSKEIFDIGDIRVIPHLLHDKYLNEPTLKECRLALYNDPGSKLPVSPLSITEYVCDLIYELDPNKKIVALGGDHSVSYPLVKSFLKKQSRLNRKTGLIHFDAHTDLLDKRLGIDLCFGSWTYHVLPYLESSQNLVQIGIRSSGQDRDHWENKFKFPQIWSHEIKEKPIDEWCEFIVSHLKKQSIEDLYISFDIDAIDSSYAAATGTPETGGLSPHESICIIKALQNEFNVLSTDLVEVAPLVNNWPHLKETGPTLFPEPQNTLQTASSILEHLV